jgi:hypothetical protein
MKRTKRQSALPLVQAMIVSAVVLAVLITGSPAKAVPVQPSGGPQTDPDKTMTLNSDGTYSCGPGYALKASGQGCEAK